MLTRDLSVVTYLFRTTGQVLGVSLSGSVLQSVLLHKLRERILGSEEEVMHPLQKLLAFSLLIPHPSSSNKFGTPREYRKAALKLTPPCLRHSITVIPTLPAPLREAAVQSYADALRVVFVCQAALAVLMLIACIPIQESPLPYVLWTAHTSGSQDSQQHERRRSSATSYCAVRLAKPECKLGRNQ
jgi:hypothetical protein